MARKVFISFLGTGPANAGYSETIYGNAEFQAKNAEIDFGQGKGKTVKVYYNIPGTF